jgi:formate dehydrogenase subunit delta
MANQIGKFFAGQGKDQAIVGTADHIKQFWDPGMRESIIAYVRKGGPELDPDVREAVERLANAQARTPKHSE